MPKWSADSRRFTPPKPPRPRGDALPWAVDDYLEDGICVERRYDVVQNILKVLKKIDKKNEVGAIVATGTSGLIIAPIIAYITGIPLVTINKEGDGSHSDYLVRGMMNSGDYIIIDDFIDSGRTVDRIINSIYDHISIPTKCIGVILYRGIFETYNVDKKYWGNLKGLPCWGMKFDFDYGGIRSYEIELQEFLG